MSGGDKPIVRLTVTSQWENGVIRSKDYPSLPEQCGSHAPLLIAAASFCQLFIEKSAEEYITVKSLKVMATSTCNMTAFYRKEHDRDANEPWKEIQLHVHVETDTSNQELQMFKDMIMKRYAAREVNDEHFAIEVAIQVDDILDTGAIVPKIKPIVNYDYYETIGNGSHSILNEQKVVCAWKSSQSEFITTTFDDSVTIELSSQENVNIGETIGHRPTPVHAYLYGVLSQFMTTMVMRLAHRDLGLEKFTGTLYTILMNGNKNYDDGLDPTVFDLHGGKINLDIVGDASAEKVQFAFLESQNMTPTYLAASGCVDTKCRLTKL